MIATAAVLLYLLLGIGHICALNLTDHGSRRVALMLWPFLWVYLLVVIVDALMNAGVDQLQGLIARRRP